MGTRTYALFLALTLAVVPASAQETRGNINGTVRDAQGVIPGAVVGVVNVATNQTQYLTTNGSGYFEAPLLGTGEYRVTVEMPGFATQSQTVRLAAGQTLSLQVALTVGGVSEEITVSSEAPLLDTSTVSSGQNYDRALIEGLPLYGNQPMMLSKYAQGVNAPASQRLIINGQVDAPTNASGDPLGGVGGFSYTIDGATNSGTNRRLAVAPGADIVEEVRVETSNFDASMGHGTGASINLVTKGGANAFRTTVNHRYWTNRLNVLQPAQKLATRERPELLELNKQYNMQYVSVTSGGPVVIPGVFDGHDKLFFIGNFQWNRDEAGRPSVPQFTVPANAKHLMGDFSDLLTLPSGSQYQIYDPLTVRPDPARPGSFIRTPFPGNVIPRDRIFNPDGSYKNPVMGLYASMVPEPNQNFVEQGSVPSSNFYGAAQPNLTLASNWSFRVDYNLSDTSRAYFRTAGNKFHEDTADWTFAVPAWAGSHSNDNRRYTWSYAGNYTKLLSSSTVLDTTVSTNRFGENREYWQLHDYQPSDFGLPTYIDDFCSLNAGPTRADGCKMPVVSIAGYQGISNGSNGGSNSTNVQVLSTLSTIKGNHTIKGGVDYRLAKRNNNLLRSGNISSTIAYDASYTRAADTTSVFRASNIGLSLAAMMLDVPTRVSIGENSPLAMSNHYTGLYIQDTWRTTPNLTLNFGLRYEYEPGIVEAENRWITGFDPDAELAITQIAEAAYAANPTIPQLPASQFRVRGGSLYAGTPGAPTATWEGQSMWMPRVAGAYKLGQKTVVKAGYGLFFDTLNAADYTQGNQTGYTASTVNDTSTDFGQTWLLGDPAAGISPLRDPFPVRADGNRFVPALGNSLGLDAIVGGGFARQNPNRQHARVQRWRVGLQRELPGRVAVEVAYTGAYTDRADININQSYIPEEFYSTVTDRRDNSVQSFMTGRVANPFYIGNFASIEASNPALYRYMASQAFFTSTTIQRQNLIRAFPHLGTSGGGNNAITGLVFRNMPLGIVKQHSLEITVNRRYANGLSANMAFSANHLRENFTVEAYDQEPTAWRPSQEGRPWRLTAGAVYELPFGDSKPFLNRGGVLSQIVGGWQTAATFEWQPGSLLQWPNLFFNGDLKDIKKDNPEVAMSKDGTLDLTKTWFNTEAGFVTAANAQPAQFQKRVFPFRLPDVRGPGFAVLSMNVVRTFDLPRGDLQFRVDIQNLFNSVPWSNPNTDPTSTNFGRSTSHPNSLLRFFTFVTKVTF